MKNISDTWWHTNNSRNKHDDLMRLSFKKSIFFRKRLVWFANLANRYCFYCSEGEILSDGNYTNEYVCRSDEKTGEKNGQKKGGWVSISVRLSAVFSFFFVRILIIFDSKRFTDRHFKNAIQTNGQKILKCQCQTLI